MPVAEARQVLGGISSATFYKLVQDGELRLVKIGRRSFVLISTLLRRMHASNSYDGYIPRAVRF